MNYISSVKLNLKNKRTTRLLGMLGLFVPAAVLFLFYQDINRPFSLEQREYYLLQRGKTVSHIANDLKRKGYIQYPFALTMYAQLNGIAQKLQAGEYLLESGVSARSLLTRMATGDVILHSLTIIEGQTFKQILHMLQKNAVLIKQIDYAQDIFRIADQLGMSAQHPEGYFFPETYSFPRGTSDIEFLQRAWKSMQQALDQEWQQRAEGLPLKTPYEALILASIIEKETAHERERRLISSVFINRLNKGIPLGTDPTIIYGLGDAFDGDLTFKHLRTDTPYNTRTRRGLPPTPIAMPGLASIRAALNPESSEMLYFVAYGDGSGTHYFSATLAEHEAAVDQYQRKRRKR